MHNIGCMLCNVFFCTLLIHCCFGVMTSINCTCFLCCSLQVVNYPDHRKSLKLADFGLASEVKSPMFLVCGTPTYVAPEILDESGYV